MQVLVAKQHTLNIIQSVLLRNKTLFEEIPVVSNGGQPS